MNQNLYLPSVSLRLNFSSGQPLFGVVWAASVRVRNSFRIIFFFHGLYEIPSCQKIRSTQNRLASSEKPHYYGDILPAKRNVEGWNADDTD